MLKKILVLATMMTLILGLAGCSRTVEDVAKWESKGQIDKLEDALTDPKFEVRKAAAESLGELKAEESVDKLAACLNDSEPEVRSAAINALADIGSKDAVMPLTAALKSDSVKMRLKAAETLGDLKAAAAIETLGETLDDPEESVRLAACRALGNIGDPAGGMLLVERLIDDDDRMREAVTTALIKIGEPAVPALVDRLADEDPQMREAAIKLLRGLGAIPNKGSDYVWYQLARASLEPDAAKQGEYLSSLAEKGSDSVSTLINAASSEVADIRELAAQALEHMGDTALAAIRERVAALANLQAKKWLKTRSDWTGAPSPLLDIYAAASALNPSFRTDSKVIQALQAGGSAASRILLHPDFAATRADIPYLVALLGDSACATAAKAALEEVGAASSTPLIAALGSTNTAIAEAAADILVDRKDGRTFGPLMQAVESRVEAGEPLSLSPLYMALLTLDKPEAQPLLMKVRPNTEWAIRVFTSQYRDAKLIGANTLDPYTDNEAPVTFQIAYSENGKPGTLDVTFKKDDKGNWKPSPALPYRLPTKK